VSRTAKYLTILLLLNLLISLMATTGLLMFILSQRPTDHNNLRCDFSGLLFSIGWGIIILLVISSVTLYLNLYKKVRSNGWLSLFSFFLLPLFTAAILAVNGRYYRKHTGICCYFSALFFHPGYSVLPVQEVCPH